VNKENQVHPGLPVLKGLKEHRAMMASRDYKVKLDQLVKKVPQDL
jgi:hypothetical protein